MLRNKIGSKKLIIEYGTSGTVMHVPCAACGILASFPNSINRLGSTFFPCKRVLFLSIAFLTIDIKT